MTQLEKRTEIRKAIRVKRNSLTKLEHENATHSIAQQIICHPRFIDSKTLAIYLSNDGELDTQEIIRAAWQLGKQVLLPVLHPFSKGNLLFLKYNQNTQLRLNKYNIAEPELDSTQVVPVNQIDVIFTPLVAFDKKAQRLGMGGGFYDRTLAKWYGEIKNNSSATPYPIGLALDCQQVNSIPIEAWDIPLPEIITPTQQIISDHFSNLI